MSERKLFSDEEFELKEALQYMRLAIEKAESAARHFELAIIDASLVEEVKFPGALAKKINEFQFPSGALTALDRVGIEYVWQLCSLWEYELRKIDGIGDAHFRKIESELGYMGLEVGCTSGKIRSRLIYRFSLFDPEPKIA